MIPISLGGGAVRALLSAVAVAAGAPAWSDDHAAGPRGPWLPAYRQECGSCHVAYPPGMLPQASWQRLMAGLPRHFGADASLDAPTSASVSAWLSANAGTSRRAREAPPDDRITRAAWFVREHREVRASAFASPRVKSPANCSACHMQAEHGIFDEHDVRIPR